MRLRQGGTSDQGNRNRIGTSVGAEKKRGKEKDDGLRKKEAGDTSRSHSWPSERRSTNCSPTEHRRCC